MTDRDICHGLLNNLVSYQHPSRSCFKLEQLSYGAPGLGGRAVANPVAQTDHPRDKGTGKKLSPENRDNNRNAVEKIHVQPAFASPYAPCPPI